ncbi:MAG: adenylate/guanylate cyclase domain-containing protein, partial [Eubacteriales bacterium]|nr:adenylate/guanylate cyclase domain-containing protein [Eubacteriales bacterium]
MLCYSCGFKLHTGDETECRLCGAKFAVRCGMCGSPNSEFSSYCSQCGEKLARENPKISKTNNSQLSENRKNVAVIFADVSGFTKLSENMDPEEVRDIINDCFTYITRPVYELEGTIDKFIGDCVMILFGAKYSHSDDARRAAVCALQMKDLVKSFSETYLSSKGIKLNLSIGVNYGLVVTGKVGNYFDQDYTVMGDTVNIAQRLQANASEGVILASESVYATTRDFIVYTDAGSINAKNRKEAVKCYSPIEVKREHLFEAGFTFLGRENEISLMNSIYARTKRAGTQLVSVAGDAGIGKTRLVKEFLSEVDTGAKKIWVECSSTFQSRSLHLLSTALMTIMNINVRDNNNVKLHRLVSFLDYIMPDFPEEETKRACDYLGMVMGLSRDNDFTMILNSMSIENIRREVIKQLKIFIENLCKKNTCIMVVDDLHWADDTSLRIMKEVLSTLKEPRIMFVLTSRVDMNEIIPGLESKGRAISLSALDDKNTKEMTCSLLTCSGLDEKLFSAVKHFTGGNPLYIKELAAALIRTEKYKIQDGIAFPSSDTMLSLPDNIQNLVLANISDLDDNIRSFLQIASVAGKYFSLTLVKKIMGPDLADDVLLRKPVMLNIIALKSVN